MRCVKSGGVRCREVKFAMEDWCFIFEKFRNLL